MRKIIDKNGRLFGRISIIDILVILVVLVLAVAVYMKFFVLEKTATAAPNDTFSFTLSLENVRDYSAYGIVEGDKLYLSDNGMYLGVVTDVEIRPATQTMIDLEGNAFLADVENRYDVTLEVASEGLISSGRYYVNRTYEVARNYGFGFYTKYLVGSVSVLDVHQ